MHEYRIRNIIKQYVGFSDSEQQPPPPPAHSGRRNCVCVHCSPLQMVPRWEGKAKIRRMQNTIHCVLHVNHWIMAVCPCVFCLFFIRSISHFVCFVFRFVITSEIYNSGRTNINVMDLYHMRNYMSKPMCKNLLLPELYLLLPPLPLFCVCAHILVGRSVLFGWRSYGCLWLWLWLWLSLAHRLNTNFSQTNANQMAKCTKMFAINLSLFAKLLFVYFNHHLGRWLVGCWWRNFIFKFTFYTFECDFCGK